VTEPTPARAFSSIPDLTFAADGLGEFVERFCAATAGRAPELVAAAVWRMRFETEPARFVRERAMRLVRNHCSRLGMDEHAARILLQVIEEIPLGNGQ
jgi:hypothetical protein